MRTRFSGYFFAALMLVPLAGCGDSQPANVMQDADAEALKDYERMLAEDGMMQDEAAPDQEKPE